MIAVAQVQRSRLSSASFSCAEYDCNDQFSTLGCLAAFCRRRFLLTLVGLVKDEASDTVVADEGEDISFGVLSGDSSNVVEADEAEEH